MLTDEEVMSLGEALEENGFSHAEIDEYFEHHGVKGQKWGVRKAVSSANASVERNLANIPSARTPGLKRTGKATGRIQSRGARNTKRAAAFILGNVPGLIAYNAISRRTNPNSKQAKKTQSGAAYAAKLAATGILLTPLSAVAYHQMAKPVRPKD